MGRDDAHEHRKGYQRLITASHGPAKRGQVPPHRQVRMEIS